MVMRMRNQNIYERQFVIKNELEILEILTAKITIC